MQGKIKVTAGILAGGKSQRMGRNKALLERGEENFLEHTVGLFDDFAQVLISVDEQKKYKDTSYTFVCDDRKNYGPLEGLYQLRRQARYPWLFLVAVDMPLLSRQLLEKMLEVDRQGVQAVILRSSDGLHPLCGMYHQSVLPILEKMFQEDIHKMNQFLEVIEVRTVEIMELGIKEETLVNINTPADYQWLEEYLNG